jgi:succinate-semialdehyde dehydrogenase/glutarate-semialdehyde dehydrogenase
MTPVTTQNSEHDDAVSTIAGRLRTDDEKAREARALALAPTKLFIAGEWREAKSGGRFAVEDPSTGEYLCDVADGSAADGQAALAAADQAQDAWAATAPNERAEILRRVFEEFRRKADDLALLLTLEMGKPVAEARSEILYSADFFRWFSGEAVRIDGGYKISGDGNSRVLVMRQPVGPCFFITPWNFPSAMAARKIAPAIAAGCTMVIRPASQTPLSTLALAKLLDECGLPSGVLNVVTGLGASDIAAPLIADPRLRKLSFTGSTEVGRKLIARSAQQVLRVSMELGGNAPFIVFEDADVDAAVEGAMVAKMRNMGQACTAANRFYVARAVAAEFSEQLAERMAALRLGRGTDPDVEIGPLIDDIQRTRAASLVDDALARGATPVLGGSRKDGPGYFYQPTVLSDVPAEAAMLREEVFGPIAPISVFDDEAGAVAAANDTEYGLVSYVYTRDIDRALRVCERLQTGMIGLNQGLVSNVGAPFGGVKQSGLGREGGSEGINEFLETKYIAVKA